MAFEERDKKLMMQILESEIKEQTAKCKDLKPVFNRMVTWLHRYTQCEKFLSLFDPESLEHVAEAAYWSVQLGLEPHITCLEYRDIRTFQPLEEMMDKDSPRAEILQQVSKKLKHPYTTTSYALQQAAWILFIKHYGFSQVEAWNQAYEPNEPNL
uniref:Uncharacterized protein n=1 Tax=viral metagenome TaxID=1070528 RepID=A0A6C0BN78_9ZZZZ